MLAFKIIEDNGPSTAQSIGEHLGRNHSPIYYALRRAYKNKLIHIKRYERNEDHKIKRADWLIVWALGEGKDAAKPGPMTSAEEAKRYYRRHKGKIALKSKLKQGGEINHWLHTLTYRAKK